MNGTKSKARTMNYDHVIDGNDEMAMSGMR